MEGVNSFCTLTLSEGGSLSLSVDSHTVWQSQTDGITGPYLELLKDGSLVIKDQTGTPKWASDTVPGISNPRAWINVNNVLVVDQGSQTVWNSETGTSTTTSPTPPTPAPTSIEVFNKSSDQRIVVLYLVGGNGQDAVQVGTLPFGSDATIELDPDNPAKLVAVDTGLPGCNGPHPELDSACMRGTTVDATTGNVTVM